MKTVNNFPEFIEGVNQVLGLTGNPPRYYEVTSITSMDEEGAQLRQLLRELKDLYEIDTTVFQRENQYREKLFALAVKDPKAFLIARNRKGEAVGYMSIFGFRNDKLLRYLERKDEYTLDIPNLLNYFNDIIPRKDWGSAPVHIYVDALAIKRGLNRPMKAPWVLLLRLIVDSGEYYHTPIKSISTVAVNERGKSLAESLIGVQAKISRETVGRTRYLFVRRFKERQLTSNWLPDLIKKALNKPEKAAQIILVLVWLAARGWKMAHGIPIWDP